MTPFLSRRIGRVGRVEPGERQGPGVPVWVVSLFLVAVLLVGCVPNPTAATSSWPGLSLSDGTIYLAAGTATFAVNAADGSMLWKYPPSAENGRFFFAPPLALPDGHVIVGDYSNGLYALDPKTGAQQWAFKEAGGRFIAGPSALNGTIFAPNADHVLYALNADGQLLWKFAAKQPLWAPAVNDGKFLYLASLDHSLYKIQPSDGKMVWSVDVGGAAVSAPYVHTDGTLYQATLAGEVVAVSSDKGNVLWRQSLGAPAWSTPVMGKGVLYEGDQKGKITAISLSDRKVLWQVDTGSAILGSGVLLVKGVAFGTEAGNLVAYDFNGQSLWTHQISGKLYGNLVLDGDHILTGVAGGDRPLVAVGTDGNEKWGFTPPK